MDLALLLVRVVVGLYVAVHGAQKLFGWFGGPGLGATMGFMGDRMLGFRPAAFWTWAMCVGEIVGGLLMALGLFGPLGPITVAATMLTATVVVHWEHGPLAERHGYEVSLTNLAVALAVALAGAGAYSLDAVLGIAVPVVVAEVVAVLALLAVILAAVTRKPPVAQPQTTPTLLRASEEDSLAPSDQPA